MIRRLFIAASALSLVLSVAMVVLSLRSNRTCDILSRKHVVGLAENDVCSEEIYTELLVSSSNGRLWAEWRGYALLPQTMESRYLPPRPVQWAFEHKKPGTYWWVEQKILPGWHGFFYTAKKGNVSGSPIQNVERTLLLPIPWLIILFTILPATWVIATAVIAVRASTCADACATCGYDLRASKDCCPECGTSIPGKQ